MSDERKAVFLSYASQDADAARRICEALRAAGVEVWFDQSELRGGDAWDAKIRKQIKECALFVPVISANTQARLEGYFRLEWKLAAQRTHTMADAKPFLVPVCIDDTRDDNAHVPEEFRAVQWTRLKADLVPAIFCERILNLLGGIDAPAGGGVAVPTGENGSRRRSRQNFPASRLAVIAIGLAAVIAGIFFFRSSRNEVPAPSKSAAASVNVSATPADAPTERAYRLTQKVGLTREDLDAADALAVQGVQREPGSARALAVRAWVQAMYIHRKFDYGSQRQQDVQAAAKRALALNADDPDALNALAVVFLSRYSAGAAEAEAVLRRALQAAPENRNTPILLGTALRLMERFDQARTLLEEAAQRNPQDVQIRFALAESYAPMTDGSPSPADVRKALQELDAAIAIQPFEGALVLKAILAVCWCGDLVAMRSALDQLEQLPLMERASDRAIYTLMWCGLMDGDLNRVLRAAAMTPRPFLQDSNVAQAKDVVIGQAYRRAGKENLAQQHFRKAELVVRERMQLSPGEQTNHLRLAHALSALGRKDEAAREIAAVEAAWREEMTFGRSRLLAVTYGVFGDAEKAAPYIERALNGSPVVTDHTLLLDPRWDPLRGQPAFEAILERCRQRISAGKTSDRVASPSDKSVAVLAFRPGSVDRENDLLCEAIPDELCNVLGQVPGLRVAASASAFSFKGKGARLRDIGAQLGVAYVVDGTVVKVGNRLRVRAELFRAADETSVWKSGDLVHELKDMFAVGDEIVPAIAKNLQVQLGAASRGSKPVHPEALALYYAGRHQWNLRNEAAYVQAESAFTRAIELDPQFALGYSGLADVWLLRATPLLERGEPAEEQLKKSEGFARQALAMDPKRPQPHATLGNLHMFRGEKEASRAAFERALAINESYPTTHHWYAYSHARSGRIDLALRHGLRAAELDPLSPSPVILDAAIRLSFLAGAYDDVIRLAERRQLLPQVRATHVDINGLVWRVRHRLGRSDEAAAWATQVVADVEQQAGLVVDACLALVETERPDLAAKGLENLQRRKVRPAIFAPVLAALGRSDEALAAAAQTTSTPFGIPRGQLLYDPAWDALREDARFKEMIAKLGFADDYRTARETLARLRKEQAKK